MKLVDVSTASLPADFQCLLASNGVRARGKRGGGVVCLGFADSRASVGMFRLWQGSFFRSSPAALQVVSTACLESVVAGQVRQDSMPVVYSRKCYFCVPWNDVHLHLASEEGGNGEEAEGRAFSCRLAFGAESNC